MEDMEFKDPQLRSLLHDSKVNMPFSDFEERMVLRLNKELNHDRSIWKSIRLSWFFFFIGAAFGVGGSFALPMLQSNILGIDVELVKYSFMIVILIVVMWQLDEMIKLTIRQKRNKTS